MASRSARPPTWPRARRATRKIQTQPLRHSRAPIYAAAGTAAAAFAVGGYLLHLDGKGTCGVDVPGACYYRYHSAPYGWTMIGAGVAAAGFGVYWQLSASGDSQAPSVSLTPTGAGALAGIRGAF